MNGVRLLGAFAAGSTATLAGFAFANSFPAAADKTKAAAANAVSEKHRLQFSAACSGANHEAPIERWDHNWDGRDPRSMVKPPREFHAGNGEKMTEWSEKVTKFTPETTRHIFLIRHGQYNQEGKTDEENYLTALGREQAALTGDRMAVLLSNLKSRYTDENGNEVPLKVRLVKSTMTRATQTGDIIVERLKAAGAPVDEVRSCDLIQEGAPCVPEPPIGKELWDPGADAFLVEGARIESGFRNYIRRADSPGELELQARKRNKNKNKQQQDESTVEVPKATVDVLVCHGNVIRYFVCRGLQLPPEAWLRQSLNNGSITQMYVRPSGRVGIQALGETGHMPRDKLSYS